jgi:soluble lytic murein transglycosylase-like protein
MLALFRCLPPGFLLGRSLLALLVLAAAAVALPGLSSPALAIPPLASPSQLCEAAIISAERAERLPERMMGAIAVVETGRPDPDGGAPRPWPWTINADGQGFFFASKQQAIEAVRTLQARGIRSIDVGCMQINLMYHPNAFASLDQAFDPEANARFAARFLTALHTENRDWPAAIAAYHSETPALGAAYRQLVMARWDRPGMTAALGHYADFAPRSVHYRDFLPNSQVYGAFANAFDAPRR